MKSQTTRRAVLAGAAAVPALSLPAIASAADDPDAKIVALGTELKKLIVIHDELWAEAQALRPPVDRIARKLQRRRPDLPSGDAWDMVCKTPAGKRYVKAYDRASKIRAWDRACEISAMQPRTLRGLGVYAMAIGYFSEHENQDLALLVRTVTEAAQFELPPMLAEIVADAEPFTPPSEENEEA